MIAKRRSSSRDSSAPGSPSIKIAEDGSIIRTSESYDPTLHLEHIGHGIVYNSVYNADPESQVHLTRAGQHQYLSPNFPHTTHIDRGIAFTDDIESNENLYYNNVKDKRSMSRATCSGIICSLLILSVFVIFVLSQYDVIHIALSHHSTYHANHIADKFINMKDQRLQAREFSSQFRKKELKTNKQTQIPSEIIPPPEPVHDVNKISDAQPEEEDPLTILHNEIHDKIEILRHMKQEEGIVMETDIRALPKIEEVQNLLRDFLQRVYGNEPYIVEMKLRFPQTMSHIVPNPEMSILIQVAPAELVPYSAYYFLQIVHYFKDGAFHRNAGHVLQSYVRTEQPIGSLAFQEYHPQYPHIQYSLGFAGRPGGPAFYISTVDNSANHGPGSQGSKTEADSCFGRIIDGENVVKYMRQQPGAGNMGFIKGGENEIKIVSLKLLYTNN